MHVEMIALISMKTICFDSRNYLPQPISKTRKQRPFEMNFNVGVKTSNRILISFFSFLISISVAVIPLGNK